MIVHACTVQTMICKNQSNRLTTVGLAQAFPDYCEKDSPVMHPGKDAIALTYMH